jgi:tRNA-dihydrouridine synthase B
MASCAKNLGNLGGESLYISGAPLYGRAFLAPMAGITDVAMRRLAQKFGASLTISEIVAAEHYARGDAANRLKAEGPGLVPMPFRLPGATLLSWRKRHASRRTSAPR